MNDALLVVPGPTVRRILHEAGAAVVGVVREAYAAHRLGRTVLPPSVFVRLGTGARIIALPAYVAEPEPLLGLKWIGSFLANPGKGMERASSVIVLNSTVTGRPQIVLEGAEISAARTAASAALAARCLDAAGDTLGIIGGGRIAFDIIRYVRWEKPQFTRLVVHDLNTARARAFALTCQDTFNMPVSVAPSSAAVLSDASTVVLATSAAEPHISHLPASELPRTLLHISLRDLQPDVIASCRNIVDDVDHVCRESTSLDLAWKRSGHREFIAGTLADVVAGSVAPRARADETVVFSPFGLGVLDIAVADMVGRLAAAQGGGTTVPDFIAPPLLPTG